MSTFLISAVTWSGGVDQLPKPGLQPRDKRHDPVATAALIALERAVADHPELITPRTAVLGVTRVGCPHHVARVDDAIQKGRPRQGYFARAGAHMIAGYAAMALNIHGPTFTISGSAAVLPHIFTIAARLMHSGVTENVIVLAADQIQNDMKSAAFALSIKGDHRLEPGLISSLSQSGESPLPALFQLYEHLHSIPASI